MTIRYAVLGAAAALALLTGCGADSPVVPLGTAHGQTVTVRTHITPGKHGAMFIEGAVPEIRLVDADGRVWEPTRDHQDIAVFRDVPPGDYGLEAALRPCDGNCGTLDGPTGRCAHQVHVNGDPTFVVTWRVGQRCRVASG
jgi:hypothetical protein